MKSSRHGAVILAARYNVENVNLVIIERLHFQKHGLKIRQNI